MTFSYFLIFVINLGLSIQAYLDEFNGVKMRAFQRLHWTILLFLGSLATTTYQVYHNYSLVQKEGFGGIVLFALSSVALILSSSLFLVICLKNIVSGIYYLISSLDTGPERNKMIDELIDREDYDNALKKLIWLERRYPTNLYLNEKLLQIYLIKLNHKRAIDKINCLCRFHRDHPNLNQWLESAYQIDPLIADNLKKSIEKRNLE